MQDHNEFIALRVPVLEIFMSCTSVNPKVIPLSFRLVYFPKTKSISKKPSYKFQVGKFPGGCTIMSLSLCMDQFLGFTNLEILLKSMGLKVLGCVCTEDFLVHGLED